MVNHLFAKAAGSLPEAHRFKNADWLLLAKIAAGLAKATNQDEADDVLRRWVPRKRRVAR